MHLLYLPMNKVKTIFYYQFQFSPYNDTKTICKVPKPSILIYLSVDIIIVQNIIYYTNQNHV